MEIRVISAEEIPAPKAPKEKAVRNTRVAQILESFGQLEADQAMAVDFPDSSTASSVGYQLKNRMKKDGLDGLVTKRRNDSTLYIKRIS